MRIATKKSRMKKAKKVKKMSKKKISKVKKVLKKPSKIAKKTVKPKKIQKIKAAPKQAKAPKAAKENPEWLKLIGDVVGQDVIPLIKSIKNQKNVSEFKIASALKQEINETRNMLYRLYDKNLVKFERKKDKKKGWYIYYWTFNPNEYAYLEKNIARDKIERLRERLNREKSTQFYLCATQCIRLDFEQAARYNFRCPECNEIMQMEDNSAIIKKIEEEIKQLSK